jgi:hypothetical protein
LPSLRASARKDLWQKNGGKNIGEEQAAFPSSHLFALDLFAVPPGFGTQRPGAKKWQAKILGKSRRQHQVAFPLLHLFASPSCLDYERDNRRWHRF